MSVAVALVVCKYAVFGGVPYLEVCSVGSDKPFYYLGSGAAV